MEKQRWQHADHCGSRNPSNEAVSRLSSYHRRESLYWITPSQWLGSDFSVLCGPSEVGGAGFIYQHKATWLVRGLSYISWAAQQVITNFHLNQFDRVIFHHKWKLTYPVLRWNICVLDLDIHIKTNNILPWQLHLPAGL